jgi:hypothetical protein
MKIPLARIARSLVVIISLTFIQVVASPILAPQYLSPSAEASTAGITTDGLVLDWNSADSADRAIATGVVPTYTTSGGGYYDLNGTSQYIFPNVGTSIGNVNGTRFVSVFMWVYPKGAGQLLTQQDATTLNCCYHTAIMEYTSTDQLHVGLWNGTDQTSVNLSSTIATPKNNWYLVGLVYDGSKINGYINGVFAGSTSNFSYSPPGTAYYGIGANDVTNIIVPESKGNMRVGGLYVYNKALSASEALSNFNVTAPRYGPTVTSPTNQNIFTNRSATFSSTACTNTTSGSATCTYQWQRSTDGGVTFSDIAGATSVTYTTPVVTLSSNGHQFRLRAFDPGTGTTTASDLYTTTSAATLTVTELPSTDTDTAITTSGTRYATLANSNPLIPGTISTITLEAWVRPSTLCDGAIACTIFTIDKSYLVQVVSGKIRHYIGSGTAWCDAGVGKDTTDAVVPGGQWTHVTFLRVNANVKIYINGQLRSNLNSACSPATQAANTNAFVIGAKGANSEPFLGHIDEVRMWSTDRSSNAASDMHSNETSTSGLAAYWNFNEGSGSIAYNQIPGATSASDLTIVDSTAWDSSVVFEEVVGAVYTTRTFYRTYITSKGGWVAPAGLPAISALVVGGGGGGGYNSGGGGSGGGVVFTSPTVISGNLTVRVGAGGEGASTTGELPSSGFTSTFGAISAAGGNPGGNYPTSQLGGSGVLTSTATSGSGGSGAPNNSTSGSAGSLGYQSAISGTTTRYSGGGGGGGWNANTGGGAGGDGGGGAGGITNSRAGKNGTTNTGGGGGGGSSAGFLGGDGGSGVIIVRWITAARPIFTQPTNDTTTAGLTDTITVSNNPISPLLRNFQWQRSTDTGTTWSNITTGSGITSNTYTTPILDTSTSGSRFQYRVIVTDSDTAGLFIVDTSTAVFIVINPPISISGTYTVQKYGQTHTDTFTAVNGTGTGNKTFTFTPNRTGLTWNGATANQATLTVASTLGPGTYLETMTATDTRGAQTSLGISVVVTKADTVTVTTLALTDTYTGSALTFTPRFTVTGLLNSDTVTPITWSYQGADNAGSTYSTSTTRPMNAGSYTISGSAPLALNDSYTAVRVETATLTINRATRTISMGAVTAPIKYGDTRTATATPSLGSGDGVITFATSTSDSCTVTSTTIRAVRPSGTCSFTATIARGNNFESATSTSPVTATLSRADTLTVRVSNPVTLTFTGSAATTLPTVTLVGLAHTDTGTATRLYSAPASLPGAPETYAALVDSPSTPVDVESYTVGASFAFTSGASSNYLNVVVETSTLRINQANQAPLRIALYNAWVGSPFTILTEGGTGLGTVVETITAGSTATDCQINSRVLTMTSTAESSCNILVTKAATRNYRAETATATINFLILVINQPSPPPGSGPNIALSGQSVITVDLVGAPTISAISPSVISLGAGGSLTITGTGFGSSPLTVKFWRDKSVTITPANGSTIVVPVADIATAGGQSGRITVINVGGTAVSVERLTINP